MPLTKAHDQAITHHYTVHYPDHQPRESDPHYKDFLAYHKRTRNTARCAVGAHRNDYSECHGPLELHHDHIEFALANGIDFKWLEIDYPGVSDPLRAGEWVESAKNLVWLCQSHHRGPGGVHRASASDWEAEKYVRGLISA